MILQATRKHVLPLPSGDHRLQWNIHENPWWISQLETFIFFACFPIFPRDLRLFSQKKNLVRNFIEFFFPEWSLPPTRPGRSLGTSVTPRFVRAGRQKGEASAAAPPTSDSPESAWGRAGGLLGTRESWGVDWLWDVYEIMFSVGNISFPGFV